MPYNTELFGKVYDQITNEPETHCQADWVAHHGSEACDTTRCVGGWAIHFTHPHVSPLEGAAVILGVELSRAEVGRAAAKLLGLDSDEARDLFFEATDEEAVALVAYYAGHRPDKIDIYEGD